MIDISLQILNLTNQGRDLIVECHPEFVGVPDDKMVKLRDEKCGSAHIHNQNGVYILKDFGTSDKGMNGIAVYAETHQMEYKEALHVLAVRYGLEQDNSHTLGPKFENRSLTGNLKLGEKSFEYKPFSKEELRFLGPCVTEDTATKLSWHSVARIIICKADKEIVINSTPAYPIFVRDMHDMKTGEVIGHKIYQPRYQVGADGKNYKFTYYPSGMQPGTYTHGLYEIECAVESGENIDKVAIVSGERDALVAKSMGVYPIWFNSETRDIPPAVVCRLFDLAEDVYYIPDVDSTGKREGMKNLKLYPLLKTVWLPENIKSKYGDQHKPCKDLRDWAGMNPAKSDFVRLLNTAKSYQFWEKNSKDNLMINQDNFLYFLNMNGYWRIWNDITENYEFVHIQEYLVKVVKEDEIRNFVIQWSQKETSAVRNLLLKNRKGAMEQLKDLAVIDIDFNNATCTSQTFCFKNTQVMVTDEDIYVVDNDSHSYFLEKKVINHSLVLLPKMFDVEEYEDQNGKIQYGIIPRTDKCKLFSVFLKTSCNHWREYEEGAEPTDDQNIEEMRSLVSKMFGFGHLMHRYRMKSRDWAPLLMDNNTKADSSSAEGGSGKSFLFTDVLPNLGYDVIRYTAKKKNPMEDDFIFDQMTPDTDVFFIDECPDGFDYDKINTSITDDIVVNKKNKSRFTIPYKQASKFAYGTNYTPHVFGGSDERRRLYMTYSDYYHYASPTNGFSTSRTIRDDFGMVLMGEEYPEEDWNRDFNFALQCEQFYLKVVNTINDKLTPDMTNIMKRHNSSQYTPVFDGWADTYFSKKEHLNCEILADSMVLDYNQSDRFPKIEKKELKRQLKAWVACQDSLDFNPIEKCNDKKNRRIKCTFNGVNTEKFYIAGKYEGQ